MIRSLDELRQTLVFPIPTRPKMVARMVRCDTTIVALDARGRIFATLGMSRRGNRLGNLVSWRSARIIEGLTRLGLLDPAVNAGIQAEAQKREAGEDANAFLAQASSLERLGVPYTPEQLRKLNELAAEAP